MSVVLVVSPHPDDESAGCGGTVRRHVLAGDTVHVLFLTSGEAGGHGRTKEETLQLRENEALAATAVLGVAATDFWRQPDGELSATPELVERLRRHVSALAPAVVYVTHPLESHADHRAAAEAVRAATSGLVDRPDVLMYEIWTPLQQMDEIIDITSFVEAKRAAIRSHKSQCDVLAFDDAILGLNRYRGEMHCWPEGEYAEAFARLTL